MTTSTKQKYTHITSDEFRAIASQHAKWLRQEVGGKKACLRRVIVTGVSVPMLDLSYATLRECRFSRCTFSDVSLYSAHLSGTEFDHCKFSNTNFTSATMARCHFSGTDVLGCTFSHAILQGFVLTGVAGSCSVVNCVFPSASMTGALIRHAYFRKCLLHNAQMARARIFSVAFGDCFISHCCMTKVKLASVDFSGGSILNTELVRAAFTSVLFRYTQLSDCDCSRSTLTFVNAVSVIIGSCCLKGASITRLRGAGLSIINCDLRQSVFDDIQVRSLLVARCELQGARGAEHLQNLSSILPEGDLIGYKRARAGRIVRLRIPADAKRSHATGRKCRASCAIVLSITSASGKQFTTARSLHDQNFVYKVGATAIPAGYSEDPWDECAPGIHFFLTQQEAMEYGK